MPDVVIDKPGSTRAFKTGDWRTFRPVVSEKCVKCGLCVTYCPDGIVRLGQKAAEIDYDYCKGCGICAEVCKVKAITMEQEKK